MSGERIIERAAPPPERADEAVFEPAPTPPEVLARRRQAMVEAYGSRSGMERHAAALGLTADAWLGRLGNVRLAGDPPDWARAFLAMYAGLSDRGPAPFAGVRRWAEEAARANWPRGLPAGPEVLEGPLDWLAGRLGGALQPLYVMERNLGVPRSWETRFRHSPALAYVLGQIAVDWLADLGAMLDCARADRQLIGERFCGGRDPGALTAIEAGLGDPHAGGRSVAILRFEGGAVVFKPKDLRVAGAIAEIARQVGAVPLATPELVMRGGYAWEREYGARPMDNTEGADEFYRGLGAWLALLQPLGGNDFWFDNLIADGATPRFIDFETAVLPPFKGISAIPGGGGAHAAVDRLPVMEGILPMLIPTRDGGEPMDMGCMCRPGEHVTPLPAPEGGLLTWHEDRFAPRYPDGTPADAADHFDAFEDGYLRTARALGRPEQRRHALEALRRVDDAPVRIILIDTWVCYLTIQSSLSPRHLADGAWREIALHGLIRAYDYLVGDLREAAVRDLRRTDVPLFQAPLNSRELVATGGERDGNIIEIDAIAAARQRLAAFAGGEDAVRAAQLRSVFSIRPGNPERRRPPRGARSPATPDNLLAWADEIASGLAGAALADDMGAPTWIGVAHDVFSGARVLGSVHFDVLSGRAGIALALLEMARGLQRAALAALARETLVGAAKLYAANHHYNARYGAGHVVGAAGLVAALANAGSMRAEALQLHEFVASREIWMQSGGDFVSGLAGWREAARTLGEPLPDRHGQARPYAPSSRRRLAPWLSPDAAAPLCSDRLAAANRRRGLERHGSWFPERWLDDRYSVSGVDGLPALAVRFIELACGQQGATSTASK